MKYSIKYDINSSLLDKIDEVIIHYTEDNSKDLIDFIKENSFRVVIDITDNEDIFFEEKKTYLDLNILKYEMPDKNFTIRLPKSYKEEWVEILRNKNINFFINQYVNNIDLFSGLIDYGVSDIYVVEALGFEMEKISAIAKEKNVLIRVFPNIAQSGWPKNEQICKFFIRPEDTEFYEPYVDIYEFFDDKNSNEILYKIYHDDKKWFGPLYEIIDNLESDVDNRFLIPKFGETRVNCGKRCMRKTGCRFCLRAYELSKTLKEAGILLIPKKEDIEK